MSELTYDTLRKIVYNGVYAMIESDSNNDIDKSLEFRQYKFNLLHNNLKELKLPHIQITGCYDGIATSNSYFVWIPQNMTFTNFRQILFKIGSNFQQESIIISCYNSIQLIYTTGINVGKAYLGYGFNNDNICDNYSLIKLNDGTEFYIGKYNLNDKLINILTY